MKKEKGLTLVEATTCSKDQDSYVSCKRTRDIRSPLTNEDHSNTTEHHHCSIKKGTPQSGGIPDGTVGDKVQGSLQEGISPYLGSRAFRVLR